MLRERPCPMSMFGRFLAEGEAARMGLAQEFQADGHGLFKEEEGDEEQVEEFVFAEELKPGRRVEFAWARRGR